MADSSPPQTDYKSHAKGYSKFISMFRTGAILAFIAAAIIVYVIAS